MSGRAGAKPAREDYAEGPAFTARRRRRSRHSSWLASRTALVDVQYRTIPAGNV